MLAFLASACTAEPTSKAQYAVYDRSPLSIQTATGTRSFRVEVVSRPSDQMRGLMYRTELAADAGMLFVFHGDEPRVFWMKNTVLPLDMIFIRSTGEVVAIEDHTIPYSLKRIAPKEPAAAVLEVTAGTAARLGIKPGDHVAHPALESGK